MRTNIMIIATVGVIMNFSVSANAAVSCGTVFPNENCSSWSVDSAGTNCDCTTCKTGYCRIGASKTALYGGETYKLYNTCTTGVECDGGGGGTSPRALCTSSTCRYQSFTIGSQLYCRVKDSSTGCNKGSHVMASSFFNNYCKDYYGDASSSGCYVFSCDVGYAVNS